jgi:hypothetical protein
MNHDSYLRGERIQTIQINFPSEKSTQEPDEPEIGPVACY